MSARSIAGLLAGLALPLAACVDLSPYAPLAELSFDPFVLAMPAVPVKSFLDSPFLLVDLDGNGSRDLVYGSPGKSLAFHAAGPRPGLSFADGEWSAPNGVQGFVQASLLAFDLDGDATPEVIAPDVDVFRWVRGPRRLEALSAFEHPLSVTPLAAIGRLTADGPVEQWSVADGPRLRRATWDGSRFVPSGELIDIGSTGIFYLHLVDLDRDGFVDVLAGPTFQASTGRDLGATVLWGGPGFPTQTSQLEVAAGRFVAAVADLDGEGLPDLVLSGISDVVISAGEGGRRFAAADRTYMAPMPAIKSLGVGVADLDRDRRPELIVYNDAHGMEKPVVILHSSDGYNFSPVEAAGVTWPRDSHFDAELLAIDVDGDARPDLATWTDTGLYVAKNRGR